MENYEILSTAGEGSYGIVVKCRHKFSNKIVAIKKLTDFGNDEHVKKMIIREVRILKKLRHENLVQLIEYFKKKRRFYLVFEYLEKTVLDDIENNPSGLGERQTLQYIYQTIRAVEFCHSKNVIHRDIKPENLLVSNAGVLKLCDFGCARMISNSKNEIRTEYVATRWYRAPELLVRDKEYGKPVDIWAIGCVFAEMLTGDPLFPGQSDVDQLYLITKCFGKLCALHQQILTSAPHFDFYHDEKKITDTENSMNNFHALHNMFPSWSFGSLHIVALCLHLNPVKRPTATELLNDNYFKGNESWFASLVHKNANIEPKPVAGDFLIKCKSQIKSYQSSPRTFIDIEKCLINNGDFTVGRKYPSSNGSNVKVEYFNGSRESPSLLTPLNSGKATPYPENYQLINKSYNFSPKKDVIHATNEKYSSMHHPQSSLALDQPESPSIGSVSNIKHGYINKYTFNKSQKEGFKNEKFSRIGKQNAGISRNEFNFSTVGDLNLPFLEITGRKKVSANVGKTKNDIGH